MDYKKLIESKLTENVDLNSDFMKGVYQSARQEFQEIYFSYFKNPEKYEKEEVARNLAKIIEGGILSILELIIDEKEKSGREGAVFKALEKNYDAFSRFLERLKAPEPDILIPSGLAYLLNRKSVYE